MVLEDQGFPALISGKGREPALAMQWIGVGHSCCGPAPDSLMVSRRLMPKYTAWYMATA